MIKLGFEVYVRMDKHWCPLVGISQEDSLVYVKGPHGTAPIRDLRQRDLLWPKGRPNAKG